MVVQPRESTVRARPHEPALYLHAFSVLSSFRPCLNCLRMSRTRTRTIACRMGSMLYASSFELRYRLLLPQPVSMFVPGRK